MAFAGNAAGSAIVNAAGPILQVVRGEAGAPCRHRMIATVTAVEQAISFMAAAMKNQPTQPREREDGETAGWFAIHS